MAFLAAPASVGSATTRKSGWPKPSSGSPRRFAKGFQIDDETFLVLCGGACECWGAGLSTTTTRSASPMAEEFISDIVERKNLAYVRHGSPNQTLDLYGPKKPRNVPLLVWIHGGAFLFGSKEGFPAEPVPLHFLLEGYAVASINYRLSSEAVFPAQLEDCKAAVRWLRAHAEEFGIDPDRIGVWGASAGGTLAALLGTTSEIRDFEVGENLGYSSRVQAVCDFFGPTDFLLMDAHRLPDGQIHDAPDSPESKLVGGPIQDNPDKVKRVNPVTYVDKNAPPFLIVHGTLDRLVPFHQSQLLAAALEAAGVSVTLHSVEGGGHGEYFGASGGCGLYADPELGPSVKAFFATHLAAK
jgi:acetyl esterase/lipase